MAAADHAAALQEFGDVDQFVLDGERITTAIGGSITQAGPVETTIEGASSLSLTVLDPDRELLTSDLFLEDAPLILMDALAMPWALSGIAKQDQSLTLIFEDAAVAALRNQRHPAKASRGKMTRAQFIRARVLKVRFPPIAFIAPQLNVKQPIEKPATATGTSRDTKDTNKQPGFSDSAAKKLKVKGTKISKSQLDQASRALGVADDLGANERVQIGMMCAAIQESTLGDEPGTFSPNSAGYAGVFQASPKAINPKDTEKQAHYWLKGGKGFQQGGGMKWASSHPKGSAGEMALAVEAPGGSPSQYQQWEHEAAAIVKAFTGSSSGSSTTTTRTVEKTFEFAQGPPGGPNQEDAWSMAGRLADEVGWRRFMVAGRFFIYASEQDLLRSRPRVTVSEDVQGIEVINFETEQGSAAVDTCTVVCRSGVWTAPPGSVAEVEGMGPADGRWLVSSISKQDVTALESTIELRRRNSLLVAKNEPAPDTKTITSTTGSGSGSGNVVYHAKKSEARKVLQDFLETVAAESGETLVVGTLKSGHSYYTTSGGVSWHSSGNAGDIDNCDTKSEAATQRGNNVAAAVLRLCGYSKSRAAATVRPSHEAVPFPALTYKGHPVQCGWKTMVGGNHYTHVHIGIK